MIPWTKILRAALPLALTLSTMPRLAADAPDLARLKPVPANETIPVSDFFRPRIMQEPKLNLAGTHIAAQVTTGSDKIELLVYELKTQKTTVIGGDGDLDVSSFDWLNNDRLVYTLSTFSGGELGLLAANLDQLKRGYPLVQDYGEQLLAIPLHDRTNPLVWDSWVEGKQGSVVVIDTNIQLGNFINMATVAGNSADSFEAKQNSERHITRRFPRPGDDWATGYLADQLGHLDFATTAANGVYSLHHFTGDGWQDCAVDLDSIGIVGPGTKAGELAVVGPRNTGRPRPLQLLDGVTGKLGEVLLQDKEYDFNGYLYRDPGTRDIVGAVFQRAGPQTVWFHPVYSKLQAVLDGFFPGVIARIIGNDEKGDRLLVSTWSDRQPPIYQWVDLAAKTVGLIKNSAPWIDPARMRPMSIMKFKTRDGHQLDAYLTLPAGASKQQPPPLVVLPHDGPLARDTWGYNDEVQFLASRGYAVMQPNYRGSPGSSWMFPESDDWDYVKMSNDVIDATKGLAASGYVDGKRVAIMGTGFGGYLALQCATSEPDLFRCVAAITGTFDWEQFLADVKFDRYTNPMYGRWIRKLGDPDKDKAKFEALSPLRRVNRLHAAVFTAVGREDWVPVLEQTKHLNSELERNHVPHESLIVGGIGRSMAYVKNRVDVYTHLEAFLAKYLAP